MFGDDLDVIDRKAQEIARLLGTIRGAASVHVESPPGIPELEIRLDPDQLSRWGFRPADVLDAIQSAYQGAAASQVYHGIRAYDVVVILSPAVRRNLADVGALTLRNPDGLAVPLRALAAIRQVSGRYQITHDGGRRMQTVSVTLGSRVASDFAKEAQARVNREIAMPRGTYAVFSGESEARLRSQRDLLMYGAMSAVGIALLLFLAMKSRRGVVLVMVNLPFALVGGVLSVVLTGGDLSLGSMVGFVTLFGISLRNSIMLISHYEHLVHVSNDQRKVIYQQRNELLEAHDIAETIGAMRHGVISEVVRQFVPAGSIEEQWDLPELEETLRNDWQLDLAIQEMVNESSSINADEILDAVTTAADEHYEAKVALVGRESFSAFERSIMLQTLDRLWREHLAALDHLRQGIHLRGYACGAVSIR